MRTHLLLTALLVAPLLAEDLESKVQGYYEAALKTADGTITGDGRCVALGKGTYRLLLRGTVDGEMQNVELAGTTEGESVTFSGMVGDQSVTLTHSDEAISGDYGEDGSLTLTAAEMPSPTLGKTPPEGAVVLLGKGQLEGMKPRKGEWPPQDEADGSIEIPKGGMNSTRKFEGDFDAHVEFMVPLRADKRSQGRGNSGVFLPNGQEIQVLDSFGTGTYLGGGCGGLYKHTDPATMAPIPSMEGDEEGNYNLASRPPLEWQAYDIEFRVEENEEDKEVGRLTVYHNGVKIHDRFETRVRGGNFHFQDHGNPVRYRNIWVKELD